MGTGSVWKRSVNRIKDVAGRLLVNILENALLWGLFTGAVVLIALFFVGLGRLAPESAGEPTTLTNATALINRGRVRDALLLDQDSRIELETKNGRLLWASYP